MVIRLTPEQAAKHILPDPVKRKVPTKFVDPNAPTEQLFDASRMFDGDELDHTTQLLHQRFISESGNNYLAIENALRDATVQLQHLTQDINHRMWGAHDWSIKRAPTKAQKALIPQILAEREQLHPNLERKARQAHITHTFAAELSGALQRAREASVADMQARADEEHDAELRRAFLRHETVEREVRYQAWCDRLDRAVTSSKPASKIVS